MAGELAPLLDGIKVVADAAAREAVWPSATRPQNARVFRIDTGNIERWSGSLWRVDVAGALDEHDVRYYGAVCDGVTDDFAAINAAFAAVKAAGKGTVSFPPGVDCAISGMVGCATLTWADRIDDCTVEGNNARLILTTAAATGNIGLGLLGNRVTVRNLRAQPSVIPDYDLSSVRANSHMVYVGSVDNTTYATDVLIENVKVYGSYLHGITLANTERLTARQLVAQDCLGTGIFGGNHRGRVILDGIVTNRTRDDGVHQDNLVTTTPVTEGLTMANVQVKDTYATGVRVSGTMRAALANIAVDNTRASAVSCLFGGYVSTVTSATNASPVVLGFASAHQFVAGDVVAVKGVLGNLGANGTWTVTVPDSTHLTLTNSAGTGAWTSGGFATRQVGLAFSGVTLTRAGRNYGVGKFAGTGADTTVNASDCGGIVVLDGTTASITMDGVNLSVTEGIGISVATCTGLTITAPVLNMGQGPTSPAAYTAGISLGKAVDTTGEGVSDFTITAPVITSPSGSGIEAFNVKNGTVTAPVIRRWRAFGGAGVRRALDISGTRVWVDNPVLDDTATSGTPSNFSGNDVGFRRPIARVTTGSVGATSSADVTVAWGQTFSNTNYTVTATVVEASGILVAKVKSLSTTGCVVTVTNSSGGALTGTIHAIATHD